jgi:hypothetical protein
MVVTFATYASVSTENTHQNINLNKAKLKMQNSIRHLNQLLSTNRVRPYLDDTRENDQLSVGARPEYGARLKHATRNKIMEPLCEIVACCRVAVLLMVMFMVLGGIVLWKTAFDFPVTKMEASE